MQPLKITLVQPDIIWEDAAANLQNYSNLLRDASQTGLIVLPEMFTTGFSMHPERLKEGMDGMSVHWMKQLAADKQAVVTGSLIIEDGGKVSNRLLWVYPDGTVAFYDKRHLFTMSGEHLHYTAGKNRLIAEHLGWRFCPLICYDLRFPVWSRNTGNYDVLLYVANWPAARHHVWKSLLIARAIENQAWCIGVNRVGMDGTGLRYAGDSAVVDPRGSATFLGEQEGIRTVEISYEELHAFRKRFPVLGDRDDFTLEEND